MRSNPVSTSGLYQLIGVYPIHPTTESIIVAARYHKYDFLINDDGRFSDPIYPENFNNLCLVELKITGEYSQTLLMNITQMLPNQRKGDGQVPYMEFYLDAAGTTLILKQQAETEANRRVCFFLHFVDSSIPLTVGDVCLPLPPPTELPNRLLSFTHYLPVG